MSDNPYAMSDHDRELGDLIERRVELRDQAYFEGGLDDEDQALADELDSRIEAMQQVLR